MFNFSRLLAGLGLLGLLASPAAGKTFEEFSAQFSGLAGEEEKADEILRLCDEALAGDAKGNARYTATALGYRSHALFLKKDVKAAEAAALEAIEADPSSALAHFIHTDVLYELERFEEARDSCLKATELMELAEHKPNLRTMCENSYAFRTDEAQKKNQPRSESDPAQKDDAPKEQDAAKN